MPRPANAKDALLAWAYHRFCHERHSRASGDVDFIAVCHEILPDIASMAADLPSDPREAVRRAKAEQDRLAGEIWETRSDG